MCAKVRGKIEHVSVLPVRSKESKNKENNTERERAREGGGWIKKERRRERVRK